MHVAGTKHEKTRRSPPRAAITCGRCYFVSDVVFTFTTSCRIGDIAGQRSGDKAAELLQQGLHLTLHGCGCAVIISHGFQQLVKTSVGVAEVQMAEDASQCS